MTIGGFNWPSLLRSLWETVIATSLSIGLIVAFREMFFRPSRLLAIATTASFGAYILQPPIVVALQVMI
jgi:glucans biosynthesis protein C